MIGLLVHLEAERERRRRQDGTWLTWPLPSLGPPPTTWTFKFDGMWEEVLRDCFTVDWLSAEGDPDSWRVSVHVVSFRGAPLEARLTELKTGKAYGPWLLPLGHSSHEFPDDSTWEWQAPAFSFQLFGSGEAVLAELR